MAMNVMSLTGNGLRDWIIQRISAVVIAAYVLFLLGFLLMHPQLEYQPWLGLFDSFWMRMFSLLFITGLITHSWIGIWTVVTDYIKCSVLRMTAHAVVALLLIVYFAWGVEILWGVV